MPDVSALTLKSVHTAVCTYILFFEISNQRNIPLYHCFIQQSSQTQNRMQAFDLRPFVPANGRSQQKIPIHYIVIVDFRLSYKTSELNLIVPPL